METLCCICLKEKTIKNLSENDDPLNFLTFLEWFVPEVEWKETFKICPECSIDLNNIHEFKKRCEESDIHRKELLLEPKVNEEPDTLEVIKIEYVCEKCDSMFFNEKDLVKHQKSHDPNARKTKAFQCPKCEKWYTYRNVMISHSDKCDGIKRHSKPNGNEWKCKTCNRNYTTEKILKAHVKLCVKFEPDDELTCAFCKQKFMSRDLFEEHENENGECGKKFRLYSCEVCSKQFNLIKELHEHCAKEHEMDAKKVKPFKCRKCVMRFFSAANLLQHKQYHRGQRTHICTVCGKTFITKSDLTVHEYTHFNLRNYKCDKCDSAFNTNKNLRSHTLVVHTDPEFWKYECTECNKKFPLKSNYDQHMKRHNGDKRFSCHICNKGFISTGELRRHMAFHSNIRPYKCSQCGKEFKDRRVHQIHMAKVHQIGDAKVPVRVKKFVCQVCPSRFFDRQKLNRHMCSHEGVKPFGCDVCEKKFTDKYYLKKHKMTAHKQGEVDADYLENS